MVLRPKTMMKQSLWSLLLMTLLLPATTALATSKRVAVMQAGTLSQVLTQTPDLK